MKCRSGEAIRGIRVRSGISLDAITILCGQLQPAFGNVITYTNDPVFGNGQGALVQGGAAAAVSQLPLPGTGGFEGEFTCQNGTEQFVHMLQVAFDDTNVNAIQARCNKILTKPINTHATLPNLTPRTLGQDPFLNVAVPDTLTVQIFNLGSAIPFGQQTFNTYFDLTFSSTQVQFTSLPTNCSFPSANTIRCPISNPTFSGGASRSFNVTYQLLSAVQGVPPFVVQTTYTISESTTSDNTYGFTVNPKTVQTFP
jgi:hypothetical protein